MVEYKVISASHESSPGVVPKATTRQMPSSFIKTNNINRNSCKEPLRLRNSTNGSHPDGSSSSEYKYGDMLKTSNKISNK